MGVILITFAILGVVLSQAFTNYFTKEKEESLKRQGEKISEQYIRVASGRIMDVDLYQLYNQFQVINEYLDASFILVDTGFNIIDVSADINRDYIGQRLESEVFIPVLEGKVVTTQGTIDGLFNEPVLTVCYPIVSDNTVLCAILMNSSVPELQSAINEAYKIGLWCLAASGVLAFALIFLSSKTMAKPLREMNEAAKVIASGDFEKRIETKSRDEVGQLAKSLNYMAESLNKQEIARREFIANVSHDFRSPLTSIRGFLQAIEDGTAPPEKRSHYIGIVLDETERLSSLAEDILTLNKINYANTELDYEDFDINELIRNTVNRFEQRVKSKKIIMKILLAEKSTYVHADFEKIARVLYNLIDNAVKFTQAEGEINIETSLQKSKDVNAVLTLSVRDNGPGIPEEDRARVFERFYKADLSRGEDKKGSGLGLSIAKEFIKAHGESISLTCEPGGGCNFKFTLKTTVTEED
jgi:signal transduction histidine kinase